MMHYDYHVVALTSSTYGIMKLVEAENYHNASGHQHDNLVSVIAGGGTAAACDPMTYSKLLRKSESMSATAGGHRAAQLLTTWTEMAMGLSKFNQVAVGLQVTKEKNMIIREDSGSVKIIPVLRDDQKSSGTEEKIKSRREPHDEEAPAETINTWELMEGLDDIVTPRSDSPLQGPMIKLAELAASNELQQLHEAAKKDPADLPKEGKIKLSRSRSLSSIEGLNCGAELELDAGFTSSLTQKPPPGPAKNLMTDLKKNFDFNSHETSLISRSWNRRFSPAATAADHEDDYGITKQVELDNSSLFDPDILASFASSVGTGRNTDQSSSSESDSSGCCSTSAAADQDVTSDQNWSRMGMTALQDQKNFCKVSFAKIAPIDAADFPETNISNQPVRSVNMIPSAISGLEAAAYERKCPPGGDERVVLYSTSLRGIRKTFQDCNKVRTILQTYVLWIDERDVSMHVEFRKELKDLLLQHELLTGSSLGSPGHAGPLTAGSAEAGPLQVPGTGPAAAVGRSSPGPGAALQVPRVFIMGYYIGGVEEVVELHETEKLGELLTNFKLKLPLPQQTSNCQLLLQQQLHEQQQQQQEYYYSGFAHGPAAESCNNYYYHCNGCGGVRFVPCPNCNGSCKIISAENSSYSNNNKIIRCPDCNENGLIRCPICL
jgi:glutaredoxin domain-containing cysteine-rich protein 1